MRNEIEKAIKETLVIENKQSVHIAVDKINKLLLEALEERSKTAESILETLNDMHSNDEISYDRYVYLFDKVASIQLDETEVKPKYEKERKQRSN